MKRTLKIAEAAQVECTNKENSFIFFHHPFFLAFCRCRCRYSCFCKTGEDEREVIYFTRKKGSVEMHWSVHFIYTFLFSTPY